MPRPDHQAGVSAQAPLHPHRKACSLQVLQHFRHFLAVWLHPSAGQVLIRWVRQPKNVPHPDRQAGPQATSGWRKRLWPRASPAHSVQAPVLGAASQLPVYLPFQRVAASLASVLARAQQPVIVLFPD